MTARFILSLDCEGKWGVADHLTPADAAGLSDERLRQADGDIVALLDEYGLPATFAFVGCFSLSARALADLRPELKGAYVAPAIAAAFAGSRQGWVGEWALETVQGARLTHEIGLHGYSHENPNAMTLQQQKDILAKTFQQLTDFVGKPPTGSVAPWWETSEEGADLLLEYGIEYDHSMMHHDSQCYWLRTGDTWTKIDYSAKAEQWMKPLVRGKTTNLVEVPASWYLDDLPPMMFVKSAANSHGWVNPRDIEQMWKDQFTWLYNSDEGDFVFPVSGGPHV